MEELLVIEVCAGSARLTKTCRKLGLRGIAVVKHTERSCGIAVMVLDLSVDSALQLLLDYKKLVVEGTQATRSSAKRRSP